MCRGDHDLGDRGVVDHDVGTGQIDRCGLLQISGNLAVGVELEQFLDGASGPTSDDLDPVVVPPAGLVPGMANTESDAQGVVIDRG